MAKTLDNKSYFVTHERGGWIRELDIPTRKQVNRYKIKSEEFCVITNDNKFLITAGTRAYYFLIKWSIRAKKQLHT